ncbi:MAG: ImmA/IrrE family metallo-endopeptidase [Candidatus Bilamarchaeaceae archaeon]
MKSVRIKVKKEILEWILKQLDEPETLHNSFPKFHEWLSGKVNPTIKQLEKLSKFAGIPLGYIFLEQPPVEEELPIPFYHTNTGINTQKAGKKLNELIQVMLNRQDWLRKYLIDNNKAGFSSTNKKMFSDCPEVTAPEYIAKKMRNVLEIDNNWYKKQRNYFVALYNIIKKLSDIGINVVFSNSVYNNRKVLDPDEFRGFVLFDDYVPFIFINVNDNKAFQMFALLYGFALVWLRQSAVFDLKYLQPADNIIAKTCYRIAAEFLAPSEEYKDFWAKNKNTDNIINSIAKHFKISEIIAARRALDLELITEQEFFSMYEKYKASYKKPQFSFRSNFCEKQKLRLGKIFIESVISAVKRGYLLYLEAYRMTGLYGKKFKLLEDKCFSDLY